MRRKAKGISILEMSLCIVAIMIIMAGAMYFIPDLISTSREERAVAETSALGGLISQYRMEVGEYPETLKDLTQPKEQYGPWIHEIPKDVYNKGGEYNYLHNENKFVVFSSGKNGSAESGLGGLSGDDVGVIGR